MRYGYEILEDRYYSDYDYEDALYERAFSEGYEYAQREFAGNWLAQLRNRVPAKGNGRFSLMARESREALPKPLNNKPIPTTPKFPKFGGSSNSLSGISGNAAKGPVARPVSDFTKLKKTSGSGFNLEQAKQAKQQAGGGTQFKNFIPNPNRNF